MTDSDLRSMFEHMLSLSDSERDQRLSELKLNNSDLHDHLRTLLNIDQEIAQAKQDVSMGGLGEPYPSMMIGPYRVLNLRSAGATGEVYECINIQSGEARVAIKVLRSHLIDAVSEHRFQQEKAALALSARPPFGEDCESQFFDVALLYPKSVTMSR